MAKNLKERICEGLEDREGHIVPVIQHLMAEAWEEGVDAEFGRSTLHQAEQHNPYRAGEPVK
jgi:hypothetical protein